MTTELMLFGIAALLLSVFEDPISKICSECVSDQSMCCQTSAGISVCMDYTHKNGCDKSLLA